MRAAAPTAPRWTRTEVAALLALAGLAAGLRFVGLDWDRGFLLHPDERNLVLAAGRLCLDAVCDPGFYAYNGFALYLDRLLATAIASEHAQDPAFLARVGRGVSAVASTLTVPVVHLLARRTLGVPVAAFVASGLMAFAPGAIQAAHFATTESLLVALGAGCALACAQWILDPRPGPMLAAAVCIGLAVGTKTAGLAYLAMPATALLLALPSRPLRTLAWGTVLLVLVALVAIAVSPHSWVWRDAFLASMQAERAVAQGTKLVFYTLSFVGGTPWIDPFLNLHWLAGPAVPVAGSLGLGWITWASRGDPGARALLPLAAFALAYFAYVGSWHAQFVRYGLPLLPALALGAAFVCARAGARARSGLAALLLLTTAVAGLGLFAIYLRPDTRLAASSWLAREARPGDAVASERRDVVLPLLQAAADPARHARWLDALARGPHPLALPASLRTLWLDGFAPDSPAGLRASAETLAAADWLVLGSRRVHAVTRAQPERFPHTAALYRLLFDGALGYEPAARFASHPGLPGLSWSDERAEETFRVFDHPTVLVFRNRRRLAPSEIARAVEREASASGERATAGAAP